MQFHLWAVAETKREFPRVVVGLVDPSARLEVKKTLGPDVLTVSVPWRRFLEFEEDVAGSFLETAQWEELAA